MKTKRFRILAQTFFLGAVVSLFTFSACDKDDDVVLEDPIASFQYEINENNYLEVVFTNYSQNASSYAWDFGDGESSTEENPTHVYTEAGAYTVKLTATNADGAAHDFSRDITIADPNEALKLLAGEDSKTWKLFREGISMSYGPSADDQSWWTGLENNGERPCLYYQTFTFHFDGTYVFDDMGMFWAEYGVFNNNADCDAHITEQSCFEAIPANMINACGNDVSAWLSGTHEFTYDPSAGTATLNGLGAWIGIPKLTADGETIVPVESVTFNVEITEETGYDLMTVSFDWGDGGYWKIVYASYSDATLEPDVVTEAEPFGEDLEDITPTEILATFASKDAADLVTIDTITSGSSIEFGVDDPTDAAADKVGKFTRTADVQYQELKFQASPDAKDIQFTNFTTAKIDVFVPADTDFAGTALEKHMVFGFADVSQTEEWWTGIEQYLVEDADFVVGEWTTYTFDLSTTGVLTREDLDMIYLGIGGGGHTAGGTFYVRNLIFE